eukprot:TRINITY_DN5411_c0_g1_i3.p1 TRINITY_DN5411_c0_g1~~TRINITY_DN5411_c0_g1_i3.p1  ORF type:complete len:259 (+),score=36.63 TRINITY_DN5411_c0_g1_i3:86-862(+)
MLMLVIPRVAAPLTRFRSHGVKEVARRCFSSSADAVGKTFALPKVPQALRDSIGAAIVDRLVPSEAVIIDSRKSAEECLPDLLSARLIGVDCEGVALGRWGRLTLCQIATPEKVYLFDALREGVIEVIQPILASNGITKVMHDCREDSSALLSQFDTELSGVFDTQVAHTMMLEMEASRPFQISLNELLKSVLLLENEQQRPLGQRMKDDPNVWFYRPMHPDLLNYAAQDVMYLPVLHRVLCDKIRKSATTSRSSSLI